MNGVNVPMVSLLVALVDMILVEVELKLVIGIFIPMLSLVVDKSICANVIGIDITKNNVIIRGILFILLSMYYICSFSI